MRHPFYGPESEVGESVALSCHLDLARQQNAPHHQNPTTMEE